MLLCVLSTQKMRTVSWYFNASTSAFLRDRHSSLHDDVSWQVVREAATICPAPVTFASDLLTLKVVSESRVTWATSVLILVFLYIGLSVLDWSPIYATDRRQTDVRRAPSLKGKGGGIIRDHHSSSYGHWRFMIMPPWEKAFHRGRRRRNAKQSCNQRMNYCWLFIRMVDCVDLLC